MPEPPGTAPSRPDPLDAEVDVSDLLATAAGGDLTLLDALTAAAQRLGELRRHLEGRSGDLPDAQLTALHTLAQDWVKPFGRVAAELEQRSAADGPTAAELTLRQREVLALLGDGLTVQAIARRLCLSPRTVGKHLERMYRRLGTSDRLTTVLRARRVGLLADERH